MQLPKSDRMSGLLETRRKALEKKNQRQAAAVTALLFLLGVTGCFFITAFTISNPPPGEQFVAVGFASLGESESASGDVESVAPSEVVEEAVQPTESESISQESPAETPIVTQSMSEVSIPTEPISADKTPEPAEPEPERTVTSALSNALSSLPSSGGGGSSGESDQGVGNEGAETGKIDGKGVVSGDDGDWALEGGGNRIGKPILDEKPQQEGVIRVNIIVDKSGAVVSATFDRLNSTFAESYHVELAIRAAKTAKFTANAAKPARKGYLNIHFELE